MTLEGSGSDGCHLSPGLLRWLAGVPTEASRLEVAAALEEELFGTSLFDGASDEGGVSELGRLRALGRRLQAGPDEENLLCLLLAVEVSPEVLWAVRALSGHADLRGIDPLFVKHLLDPRGDRPSAMAQALDPDAPLFRYGLVLGMAEGAHGEPGPMRLAPPLLGYLLGHEWSHGGPWVARYEPGVKAYPGIDEAALVPAPLLEEVQRLVSETEICVLSSPRGGGANLVARMVAGRLGHALVVVDMEGLCGSEPPVENAEHVLRQAFGQAVATGALLLVLRAEASVRSGTLPSLFARLLKEVPVPVLVEVAPHAEARILAWVPGGQYARIAISIPGAPERERLWRTLLETTCSKTVAHDLAASLKGFPLGPEQIASIWAKTRGDASVGLDVLQAMAREATGHRLGALAVRVPATATWDEVVLPEKTHQAVIELLAHARHMHKVLDEWGFARHLHESRAISALFSGPPGTGKTLVASLIARELGVELYRVDLARVVSKYIGETEERLARLFDEARAGGVCLLFDEADALFARRTEVRSSVDRYANLEVDFLLQKLEEYDGVVILTTNFPQSIDEAFLRRIKFRIQFPKPDVQERLRLWRRMIPPQAPVEPGLRLEVLAEVYELTGAEIRNAVLRAAFMAAEASKPLSLALLDQAARTECEQLGRVVTRTAIKRTG